jgi:hypothetical protein
MTIRVLAGLDTDQVVAQLRRALADPEVQSVVIHNPGSHLRMDDGREVIVTADGQLVTADGGMRLSAAEGVK